MAFFRNDTVNWLNLHYGVRALATGGGGAFYGAFLLKSGVSAPMVLVALALILAGRFCIRPLILPAARRLGLRALVATGALLGALPYPILEGVHGVGPRLWLLCAVSALADVVYWTSYHAYFAALGDKEHRGHQISARDALVGMVGIIAPLLAGLALARYGPGVVFGATAVIQALSALPFLATPDVKIAPAAPGVIRAAASAMLMFAADGWIQTSLYTVWTIALFVSVGESFPNYGGAMALGALIGVGLGLFMGRGVDFGHGRRAVFMAGTGVAAVMILRAASFGHPWLAVAANTIGILGAAYNPALMTAVYNLAKGSPCTLRFHIVTEGGWDIGATCALLVSAGLLWAGASFSAAILLGLVGVGAFVVLLARYYRDIAAV